jgi:DNA-directed RNA polymerase subunit M/transcription elongation factor TFIIS
MTTRTTKKLHLPPPPLHDKLSLEGRWRTVKLLSDLLQSLDNPLDVRALERHLFVQSQGDVQQYESAVYRLCAMLHLRRDKVSGRTPEQLVAERSSHADLGVEGKQKLGDVKSVAVVTTMPTPKTVECQIKCGRCKSTQVSVEQKQTRGADESMTVFVQCEKCGLRWKM